MRNMLRFKGNVPPFVDSHLEAPPPRSTKGGTFPGIYNKETKSSNINNTQRILG